MPNYVYNRVTVIAKDEAMMTGNELILAHCFKNGKEISFDFNSILPMPKELDIIAGSITEDCVKLFLNSIKNDESLMDKYMPAYFKSQTKHLRLSSKSVFIPDDDAAAKIEYIVKNHSKDGSEPKFATAEDVLNYGRRALDNVLEFGAIDWYDWSVEHWGTKWNACDTLIEGDVLFFSTAWSDVRTLMRKWSAQHPQYRFQYEYAEEQTGHYTGWAEYDSGEEVAAETYADYSKEAYELAFELVGGEDDYVWDDKLKTYTPKA